MACACSTGSSPRISKADTGMQVDFYQLRRDPVEQVLPAIAQRLVEQGERLLVIDGREGALPRLSQALWNWRPEGFLAHGLPDDGDPALQPVLLCDVMTGPANGARHIALADGVWREEAVNFERAFYFFGDETLEAARTCWRMLKGREDIASRFWRQEGKRWVQGP